MKKVQLISANEWRLGHPKEIGVHPSDMYYAGFCTSLLREIDRVFNCCELPKYGRREFALLIGHYVEDVVSQTHVFDSFRRLHEKMYGRKLPFYDIDDEYFEDEVNLQDIKFLVWDHCQVVNGNEAIINPDNKNIDLIGKALFPLICKAYEEAPEVEALHDFVFDKSRYTDFVESKHVLYWLLMNNPITSPDDILETIDDEMDSYLSTDTTVSPSMLHYGLWSLYLFLKPCNFLALNANEWLAEMLRTEGMDEEAEKMDKCRHTGIKDFEITKIAKDLITLEDCENGEKYSLLVNSLGSDSQFSEHLIMHCDLATIDGMNWEMNGFSSFSNKKPEKKRFVTDGEDAYNLYMKKLGGRCIAYYKNLAEMREKLLDNVQGTIDSDVRAELDNADGITIFVNSDGSLNVSPPLTATIPDPENPYFKEIDKTLLLCAIFDKDIASYEMIQYLHSQGWLDDLALTSTVSPERGHELLHGNLDFLMRYFRRGKE